jgi:hypothetical protein
MKFIGLINSRFLNKYNLVSDNLANPITKKESNKYLWQFLTKQSIKTFSFFNFVTVKQWIMLLLTNVISIGFIFFAYSYTIFN